MDRDVFAAALGTSLADPKDISPRVKSSFFFAEDGARGLLRYPTRWVNEMYLASATPINGNTTA